jgi:hypothetical protein
VRGVTRHLADVNSLGFCTVETFRVYVFVMSQKTRVWLGTFEKAEDAARTSYELDVNV